MHRTFLAWFPGIALSALGLCALPAQASAEGSSLVPKSAEIAILRNPGTPPAGSKNADVILVEYFDYNCPFCKKLAPALERLIKADSKVALVYKDWPILSDVSAYAARRALAADWQGKYAVAHDTLMRASHLASDSQVDTLLAGAGIDLKKLDADSHTHAAEIHKLLQRNDTEARALGIRGTPGLLVGRHMVDGVYTVSGLQQAVALARASANSG
ncbi:MAG TPA: DsbA family protein [Steroidobacteraceae bacterium]|nr:DsbA family protein [Steroidobacteraceae bacterium]